jgi:protein-tyrosine-phosphatase
MKYTVKSPVDNYKGVSAGVQFSGGVGETDNDNTAEWFRRKGYEVTENAPKKSKQQKGEKPDA